ncbi:maleylpyruvate isomerase family mycothiol-dependent enzyme [Nocardia cerradoensis]|uniref:maleylpyruvate isomerase family mycothiol-dependent enzyme n=1 Tax=Nocardia cerradoensis TaxID=85688 RepID=UPI0002D3CF38|nr:maleylpyruvate isomerase family mycothiol-dependent enzyme [Nocardia cerradoensis]NKY43978.1 maleylpyruvate isomerase family mycothiol-dependent enzyme [Nocardia cerradoensis]
MALTFERYCDEIVAQTELLRAALAHADTAVPVPSCPGWTVGQLGRHLGGAQRWARAAVAGRVREPLPENDFAFRDLSGYLDEDPEELRTWLAEGAADLSAELRRAGPGLELWTPVPVVPTTDFYARRFTHETLIHRADATLALGADYQAAPEVAADAIDEWLELASLPVMFEYKPESRELLGPGRTLHFHATDTPEDLHAEWIVDLTGEVIAWRRAHERAAVAVRGPLTELLLVIYRRRTVEAAEIEILGDRGLFDFWLDRVSFG